jgi:hypothetical protein
MEGMSANLLSHFGHEGQLVHISKNGNVKEYWRLKPLMDAAQTLPPTEASETCILCVLVC